MGVAFRPSRGPDRVQLAVPGVHNAGNACAAALVLEELGVPLAGAFAALETFAGAGRRFETGGRARRDPRDRRLRAPSGRARGDAGRRAGAGCRAPGWSCYFQPHMPWRTRQFAAEFAEALQTADVVVLSRDVRRPRTARSRRLGGGASSTGCRRSRRASRSCSRRATTRRPRRCAGWCGAGDLVLCCGAGPVDAVARAVLRMTTRPAIVQERFPLARLTTIGTGGPARFFARPGRRRGAARLPGLGGRRGACRCGWSASARTCCRPTRATTASCCDSTARWRRSRSTAPLVRLRRRRVAGRDRAQDAGRRPVGHRVRLRDPRHRRRRRAHERGRLRPRDARAAGARPSSCRPPARGAGAPDELGLRYRGSDIAPDEVVARAVLRADGGRSARRSGPRSAACRTCARPPSRARRARSGRCSRTRRATAPAASCSRRAG